MTPDYARTLLDYNYWARDRVFSSVDTLSAEQLRRPLVSSFPSILDTLTHMYSGESLWYQRWAGHPSPARPDLSGLADVPAVRAAWAPLERQIRDLVGGLGADGLMRTVEYKALTGQVVASPHWQMIAHVVNHGTQFRGEAAVRLTELDLSPGSLDLTMLLRGLI